MNGNRKHHHRKWWRMQFDCRSNIEISLMAKAGSADHPGTVEAAIVSAKQIAACLLKQ